MHEHDITRQFLDAMREHGLETDDEIVMDGRIRRFHVNGDRKHVRTGWYVVHGDEHPAGAFGCCKRFGNKVSIKWSMKGASTFTPEERREWGRKMNQARRDREEVERKRRADAADLASQMWEAAEPASDDHPYLKRKGVKCHGLRVGVWPIANPDTGEITIVSKLALLVPIRASRTEIHSLQAIFPNDRNVLKRDKDFLKNGAKHGLFFTIGTAPLNNVFVVCEGYATGATIYEVTGHLVFVGFDASNLEPVAAMLRNHYPDATIIIAADNDQWTKTPIDNPGVTRAFEAGDSANALVAIPQFQSLDSKPTDFNDLFRLEGSDAVRAVFDAVLAPSKVAAMTAPPAPTASATDATLPAIEPPKPAAGLTQFEELGKFTVLGYDHGSYFIFHHGKKQILVYTKGEFTDNGLIELAELNFWEEHFAGDKSINRKAAFNWFVQVAHSRGIYDLERIRGRGVWTDSGRLVFHHGDRLSVDGVATPITQIKSRYVYELSKSLPEPADTMLSDEDGRRILDVAKMFRWTKPASAALLAGWVMLAPICGALKWRPHVWLTGGPGCGKSTVLTYFVYGLIRNSGIYSQGASTEPGLRQILKADALPVMLDEAEQAEEGDKRRMQNIISMIRQSSSDSEARTFKGTIHGDALRFHIRSMFCLASIQVGMKNQADIERLTVLVLRGKANKEGSEESVKEWKRIEDTMYATIERDDTISTRLLRRSVDLLPVIKQNIEVFTAVGAEKFGTQREGDQYGTLLAGAWALVNQTPATKADAQQLINSYDWSEHRDKADTDDSMQALSALTEAHIRVQGGAEVTVYELICASCDVGSSKIPKIAADAALLRFGMRIKDSYLIISNVSHELKRLVEGTTYEADLRGMLLRVAGADRNNNQPMKFNGVLAKCIRVPVGPMIIDEPKRLTMPSDQDSALSWHRDP